MLTNNTQNKYTPKQPIWEVAPGNVHSKERGHDAGYPERLWAIFAAHSHAAGDFSGKNGRDDGVYSDSHLAIGEREAPPQPHLAAVTAKLWPHLRSSRLASPQSIRADGRVSLGWR